MNPFLTIAIRAAQKAGTIITRGFDADRGDLKIDEKTKGDFVTSIDKAAESAIIDTILSAYPEHQILSEERGLVNEDSSSDVQWIVDPLDGTRNFMNRLPHFAVSIAVREKGQTTCAVVFDPIKNELFSALKGQGAKLNDARIRVSNHYKNLENTVIATGFPFKTPHLLPEQFTIMRNLMEQGVSDFRRTGSAALDLSYVACGRVDGFFEIGLKPWDMAAGELIAREAGALVTDFTGFDNYLQKGNIICAQAKILKNIASNIHLNASHLA